MAGVAQAFKDGGIWMYPILLMSIFSIAVVVERVIWLWFKYNINGDAFMRHIKQLVINGDIDSAIRLCNASPHAALPRVLKSGLEKAGKSELEIQNAVEEKTLEVIPQVVKRTHWLSAFASIATLMGLLGTIAGLIEAFDAVARLAPDKRAEALTASIAIAMNTTAFGLIVAIPTLLAHLFLSTFTKGILDEIDRYSVEIENLLISLSKGMHRS